MGSIDTSVSHIGIHTNADRADRQFQGTEGCLTLETIGSYLIHGNPIAVQIKTQGLADGLTGEKSGCFDIVAVSHIACLVPQMGWNQKLLLKLLQWRKSFGQSEITTFSLRGPGILSNPIGHEKDAQSTRPLFIRGSCLQGGHGLQPR